MHWECSKLSPKINFRINFNLFICSLSHLFLSLGVFASKLVLPDPGKIWHQGTAAVMTIRGIRHLLHHQLCLLGFEHLLKYTAGSQATTSSGQHIHTLHISTLPFRLDCLRKKQDSIPLRTARQGHGLFLYWTLSCGSLDCSATKHAVCASENEELKKNRVLLHHRNRTTKKQWKSE